MPFYSQTPVGYGHPFASSHPTYHHSTYDNFDLEEQAALAHLASIRQRREVAEQVAQREAAIQAHIAAQKEAAFIAAVEREQLRQQAIRQHIAAREEREQAVRRALIARQEREQAIRQAIAAQEERAFAIEHHRRQIAGRQAHHARAIEESRRRKECARRCAGSCHKAEASEGSDKEGWKQFNDVLGAMFGINLEQAEKQSAAPVANEPNATKSVDPASVPSASGPIDTPKEPADEDHSAAKEDPRVVTDLGDLISKFLNVNIEPAAEAEQSTAGADALTARVNDFLHQFGLEFEPEPVPAKERSDKGKGVAEGEKPNRPASPVQPVNSVPVEAAAPVECDSSVALNKLRDISHELSLVTESFTFPTSLAFAPTPSAEEAIPPLLFNKANSGYHAQAHKLLQLLLAVDGVSSGGNKDVRKQRKAIVKAIEGAIEKLEQKRDAVWNEVKERRERGEESDDEGSVSSWATESTHDAEHIEHADAANATDAVDLVSASAAADPQEEVAGATGNEEVKPVEGFEVPDAAEQNDNTGDAQPTTVQEAEKEEKGKAASEDKDEFELL